MTALQVVCETCDAVDSSHAEHVPVLSTQEAVEHFQHGLLQLRHVRFTASNKVSLSELCN